MCTFARTSRRGGRQLAARGFAAVFLLALGGCGGAIDSSMNAVGSLLNAGAGPDEKPKVAAAPAEPRCPRVSILPETEVMRRETGEGGNAALQWQASIAKTARACAPAGEGVTVRVGISGRIVQGPKASAGAISLPIRVAVKEGNDVTYSKLHTVSVSLDAPSKDWAFVDENVTVGQPGIATIIVGFDD